MFFLIGIILSAFLFALLLLKRSKSHADRILTVWMVVMAAHQGISYLTYSGVAFEYPHLLGIALPWPLLHGPFLFLYVLAMTREKPVRWVEILPHFVPFLILYLLAIPFFRLTAAEKLKFLITKEQGMSGTARYRKSRLLFWVLHIVHGLSSGYASIGLKSRNGFPTRINSCFGGWNICPSA